LGVYVLFEEYVGRVCQDVLEPKGLDVDLQEVGSLHLAEEAETRRRTFLLRPDILVWKGRSPRVVADTKWKRLDPRKADLGVSGEDVYQVLAYAHRYATDTAVLIYPHHAAVGRPGLQRDFVIQGGGATPVVVRVMTVDLAKLEGVPGELEAAIGAGKAMPASVQGAAWS
jgi:5-methylcytosine-specific restriction enzyme subunit McrC